VRTVGKPGSAPIFWVVHTPVLGCRSMAPKDDSVTTLTLPVDELIGYQLRRASNVLQTSLAGALAEHRLSVTEASVLLAIAANREVTQSIVGRLLDIQRANMAPLASKLALMGLTLSERRGREQLLRVSAEGRRVATRVLAIMRKHDEHYFGAWPPARRAALHGSLRDLWQLEGAQRTPTRARKERE
jgi:DNA-binding MarR family transcriptional regulator